MQRITKAIAAACQDLFGVEVEPLLTRPEEQFGDYSTNVALQLGGQLKKNPREIAVAVASKLHGQEGIAEVNIAGPGFINLKLTDQALLELVNKKPAQTFAGQTIVAEYSDPNPFKILHVGHFYTSVVGDAISNLFEGAGASVHRVNFGGDVGLHVAKTMWAMLQKLGGENPENLSSISPEKRAEWMAQCYVMGTQVYEDNPAAAEQIKDLNKRVYQIQQDDDHDSPLAQIYWTTRQWSYEYFESFYQRIGSGFEKYYPESATVKPGMEVVQANIGKVFEKSDGAVVFVGEVHNMHTRVFINSQGLPTYETKDVGLMVLKNQDYHFDRSIIITGNEQADYMQVVLKAVEQIEAELTQKTTHLTHGMVRLPGSVKMSSRRGNIVTAEAVLDLAKEANREINNQDNQEVSLAAVKYAFLKNRIGADLVYDPAESVALEGNSGPYLQYAHARARSILKKAQSEKREAERDFTLYASRFTLEAGERSLVRKLGEYAEVIEKATQELMPHHICTYLYELAQTFNRFYEQSRVINDPRQEIRLQLVQKYADALEAGLGLLGISAPDRI